jgi:hypothetical protein
VNNYGSELCASGIIALHMYSILLIVVRGSAVVTMEVPQYPFAKRGCYRRQYIALSTGSNSNRCCSLLASFPSILGISLPGAGRRIHHLSTVLPRATSSFAVLSTSIQSLGTNHPLRWRRPIFDLNSSHRDVGELRCTDIERRLSQPSQGLQNIRSQFSLSVLVQGIRVDVLDTLSDSQGCLDVASVDVKEAVPADGDLKPNLGTQHVEQRQLRLGRKQSPGHAEADLEQHATLQGTKSFALSSRGVDAGELCRIIFACAGDATVDEGVGRELRACLLGCAFEGQVG